MKKIMACLLAAVLLLSLAGCGESGSSGGESAPGSSQDTGGQDGKLVVWIPGSGDATYDEAWNTVLETYQAQTPGFEYELTFIPWGEYFTKLNAAFAGGMGPDLFGVGYGQLGTLQHNGNLLQVEQYIAQDWDGWQDIGENVLKVGQKDGSTYALLMPDVRTLLYRTDIAEQNGVTEDELRFASVEELKNLAEKMTVYDENGKVEVAGLELRTSTAQSNEQNFFILSTWFDGGDLWNAELTANFAGDANAQALELMQEMLASGVAILNEPGDSVSQFVNGTAAMTLNIESILASARQSFPGQVAAICPDMDTLTLGTFYSVNAATKYPQQAADLLAYVFSAESQKVFASVMGQTPSRSSLADWFIEQDASGDNVEIIQGYEHARPYSDAMNYEFLNLMSLLRTAIEDVLYNGADPAQALSACAQEYDALF